MKRSRFFLFFSGIGLCLGLVVLAFFGLILWSRVRPQPRQVEQTLYQGINYNRTVQRSPRPMVIHRVTVDLRTEGLRFFVTPGDPNQELPLQARTTGEFLSDFKLQLAVNGGGFTPWRSAGFFKSYPHSGDPVAPLGLAASNGNAYGTLQNDLPVLYIARTNRVRIDTPVGNLYNALSGDQMLVERGQPSTQLESNTDPRTAIGLDKQGRTLIIILVDGRQPGYSEGATLIELAQILIDSGAYTAMNLDGGGSSTLVKSGPAGLPVVLNSPIDQGLPGKQRPVGNHLGIFAPENK